MLPFSDSFWEFSDLNFEDFWAVWVFPVCEDLWFLDSSMNESSVGVTLKEFSRNSLWGEVGVFLRKKTGRSTFFALDEPGVTWVMFINLLQGRLIFDVSVSKFKTIELENPWPFLTDLDVSDCMSTLELTSACEKVMLSTSG